MFELKIGKSGASEAEEEKYDGGKCSFNFLKKVLEGVGEIIKSSDIKITAEGLYIQAMDPMHVSMVDIFLKNTAFESYRCDKNIILGVPLPAILKIFRSLPVDGASSVLLSADDDATDLNIVCEEGSKKYSYKLKLMSTGEEEYSFPAQVYDASIEISAGEMQRVIRTLGAFGEILQVSANQKGMLFTQQSDVGDSEVFFSMEESGENSEKREVTLNVAKDTVLSFPYKYLATFGKFGSLGHNIRISMSEDYPVHVALNMSMGYLNYYIAPREQ
ncbi:proliferating cell nuclear antigen [Nematocida homosporus]|uniref:proliferating cell nuclear antigen n=1 Tax=Nematocida homosporus TaxID=1912981 RepID=UPI00222089D9|nr:proliferating cell nuclear antigen [Nematocida homosporus]KAI5185233.1 proliferating cell nuclear antigen [Nematocida homosporus]